MMIVVLYIQCKMCVTGNSSEHWSQKRKLEGDVEETGASRE